MDGIFPTSADSTIDKVRAVYAQREGEYADTWHLDNQVSALMNATLARFGVTLSKEQRQLVQLAVLVDIKFSRLIGPYKEDTLIDAIAYMACYNTLRVQYEADDAKARPTGGAAVENH